MDIFKLNAMLSIMLEVVKDVDDCTEMAALLGTLIDFWGGAKGIPTEDILTVAREIARVQGQVYDALGRAEA